MARRAGPPPAVAPAAWTTFLDLYELLNEFAVFLIEDMWGQLDRLHAPQKLAAPERRPGGEPRSEQRPRPALNIPACASTSICGGHRKVT